MNIDLKNLNCLRKQLEKGDLVCYYDRNVVAIKKYKKIGIVIEKTFLYKENNQFGVKIIFEYKILLNNNKIDKIKTNNIKILNIRKP